MKKSKITPLPDNQNKKILIGDELSSSERVEYICSQCHCGPLVTITDKTGNTDRFCRQCSAVYSMEDDTVRHRHRLTVPEETEPAVTSIQYDFTKDVEVRHPKKLRGGIAELHKRGLKITYFEDSSQR